MPKNALQHFERLSVSIPKTVSGETEYRWLIGVARCKVWPGDERTHDNPPTDPWKEFLEFRLEAMESERNTFTRFTPGRRRRLEKRALEALQNDPDAHEVGR